MDQAMADLAKQSFKALVDTSGAAEAIAAVKPYKNRNAYILICMVKKKMSLKGPALETLIIPMCMAHVGIGGIENVHSEIREKGAVCYVEKCPYGDAMPEFCVVISHYTTDLICEAMNPDYECIWTHHLSNGDPYDRYIYRKKAGHYANVDDLGQIIKVIPRYDVPKEDERALRDYVLFNVLDGVVDGYIDVHGSEKALKALLPLARKIGSDTGKRLAEENPGMMNNAATLGHLIDQFGQATMQRGSTEYLSKNELGKEITDCPFQTFTYEMCKLMESLLQGVVESLNPDLTFAYDSMMTKGDSTCRWHLSSKGEKLVIIQPEKAEVADPLSMLKMRLAKGEISKQEYEEIKAVISA